MKLIRFEYDPSDGEVRPGIGLPLEDAYLTQQQLVRCIRSLLRIIEYAYPTLDQARRTGRIQFPDHDK